MLNVDEVRKTRDESPRDWRNISSPEAIIQPTSYAGDQTEVSDIYEGLKQYSWPDVWYELVQGAFEYNDWKKGSPDIYITFANGKTVPLADFLRIWPKSREKVARIQVKNYIHANTGLRPSNLYLTQHQEKAQSGTDVSAKRISRHGRGLKSAVTAIVANNLAKLVSFESYTPDLGSWYAEASMAKDKMDATASSHYQIAACFNKQEQLSETIITIEEPTELLLKGLFELPEWFIPLNVGYQFSPHYNYLASQQKQTANLTTLPPFTELEPDATEVSANEVITYHAKTVQHSQPELDILQHYTENRRSEILSPSLFDSGIAENKASFNWLVVDGWRLALNGTKPLANIYAFTGWGDSKDKQRKAERSPNSRHVNGNFSELVVDALCFCENPTVFYNIITKGLSANSCYEWEDIDNQIHDKIKLFPKAYAALQTAFAQFLKDKRFSKFPLYLVQTSEEKEIAAQNGLNYLHIKSTAWANLLRTEKVLPLLDYLEAQRIAAEASAANSLRSLGFLTPAKDTKEQLSINLLDKSLSQQDHFIRVLLDFASRRNITITFNDRTNQIELNFPPKFFPEQPESLFDLGVFNNILKQFFGIFPENGFGTFEMEESNTPAYFVFGLRESEKDWRAFLSVKKGSLVPTGNHHITLKLGAPLKPDQGKRHSKDDQPAEIIDFLEKLKKNIQPILNSDGSLNTEKFLASQWASNDPETLALMQTQEALKKLQDSLQKNLEVFNMMRAAMGQKPFTQAEFMAMLDEKNSDKAGSGKTVTPPIFKSKSGKRVGVFLDESQNTTTHSSSKNEPKSFRGVFGDYIATKNNHSAIAFQTFGSSLSKSGEKQDLVGTDKSEQLSFWQSWRNTLVESLEKELRATIKPDLTFDPGPYSWDAFTGHFAPQIDELYSETEIKDYLPLTEITQTQRSDAASIKLNKPSKDTGLVRLECPYGFEPVGYFCPDNSVTIHFTGLREKGVFASLSEKGYPKGTIFYFQPIENFGDTSLPDEIERSTKVIEDQLEPHWQNLIAELRGSNMTDKQKVDVLLRAWKKAQIYLDTQQVFDQYSGLGGVSLATTIANIGLGDCGYISLGFAGLVSTLLPTRQLIVRAPKARSYSLGRNGHGLTQVYIDGRWVTIEAQGRYVDIGYQLEPIPEEHRAVFESLLNDVPQGMSGALDELTPESSPEKVGVPGIANTRTALQLWALKKLGLNTHDIAIKLEILRETSPEDSAEAHRIRKELAITVALNGALSALLAQQLNGLVALRVTLQQALAEGLTASTFFEMLHQNNLIAESIGAPTKEVFLYLILISLAFKVGKYYSEIRIKLNEEAAKRTAQNAL